MTVRNIRTTLAAGLPLCLLAACSSTDSPGDALPSRESGAEAALTSDPALAGVAGCWQVTQGRYSGIMTLRQEGSVVTGFMDWQNHEDAFLSGVATANGIDITFRYFTPPKEKLVGRYLGSFVDPFTLKGFTGDAMNVAFTAKSITCAEISGCWRITHGVYAGTLSLVQRGGLVTGFMDWQGTHPNATVAGTYAYGRLGATLTYRDEKEGVVGRYEADVSADRLQLLNGLTWDLRTPGNKVPFDGHSVPCKDISGCFSIEQVNGNGMVYTGLFRLSAAADNSLTGTADWANHEDGIMSGHLRSRRVHLLMTFPGTPKEGLEGTLDALADHAADRLAGGTVSNTGDRGTWKGRRALCPAP